jgi:hypothetical protein
MYIVRPRFPIFLPRDHPPAPRGTTVNGKPTPPYALGWVRDAGAVYKDNPDVSIGCVTSWVMLPRWHKDYREKFPECVTSRIEYVTHIKHRLHRFLFQPDILYGPSTAENPHIYHLFALNTNHATIHAVVNNDELLEAGKECMGIPPAEEYTLTWFRLPIKASTHNDPRQRKL